MDLRKFSLTCLLLTLGLTAAQAKEPKYEAAQQLTAEQAALIEKAIAREKITIKNIQQRTPLVETYIQDMRPDVKLYAVPVQDHYMLSRVDFGKTFVDKAYEQRGSEHKGLLKGSLSAITGLTKAFKLEYVPNGFMQMMFLDPSGFDQQHYVFSYVRRDFLGSVRTWVFDVHPKPGVGAGRFSGRIWIEDQAGNVVRFNGTYTGNAEDTAPKYFHFDSWRMNLQPDLWLPVAVYAEETQRTPTDQKLGFRAQTRFWGYSLKLPTHESENVSIKVDDAVDKSDDSQDVSPLQASRAWVSQAEENVLDRLVQAGLLAPPSDFDKILEQIATNLAVPSNLAFTDPIHCRVLLTTPLEALAVGNTILVSKGLIDTLPSEEAIASVVSFELAHIALGHHIDTRYAFNDRLLFPDESTFSKINMLHTDADNASAAKKAMEMLNASMYKDKLGNAGLYYVQLQARAKELTALNTARVGDSLLRPDGIAWMGELTKGAPKLDVDKLDQVAALPLGSNLKTDPWSDKVMLLNAKRYAPMNARDKMPLEVTPIVLKLQRFEQAAQQQQQQQNQQQSPAATPASGSAQAQPAPSGN